MRIETDTYQETIVNTFRRDSIRTAILIDDQFPKYDEVGEPKFGNDYKRARAIYDGFRKNNILCDVENRLAEDQVPHLAERIRRSDLIVLDWKLAAGEEGLATRTIVDLAKGDRFKLVALYTLDDLSSVFRSLVSTLRFANASQRIQTKTLVSSVELDLNALSDILKESVRKTVVRPEDSTEISESAAAVLELYNSSVDKYLNGGVESVDPMVRRHIKRGITALLQDLTISDEDLASLIDWCFAEASKNEFSPTFTYEAGPGGWCNFVVFPDVSVPCIVCDSVLVALIKKTPIEGQEQQPADVILEGLDSALKTWAPNPVQLLALAIRNELNKTRLGQDRPLMNDKALHAGWLHGLFSECGESDGETLKDFAYDASQTLIKRVVEGMCQDLVESPELADFGSRVSLEAYLYAKSLKDVDLDKAALALAGMSQGDWYFAMKTLNAFLCTTNFNIKRITTGTVFYDEALDKWFACVTPACDMVRRNSPKLTLLKWDPNLIQTQLLRLHAVNGSKLNWVENVEHGRMILFRYKAEIKIFSIVHDDNNARQPIVEWAAIDSSDIPKSTGNEPNLSPDQSIKYFYPSNIINTENKPEAIVATSSFKAVAQLRPEYAANLLHTVGSYSSRIGLGFVGKRQSPKGKADEKKPQPTAAPSAVQVIPKQADVEGSRQDPPSGNVDQVPPAQAGTAVSTA